MKTITFLAYTGLDSRPTITFQTNVYNERDLASELKSVMLILREGEAVAEHPSGQLWCFDEFGPTLLTIVNVEEQPPLYENVLMSAPELQSTERANTKEGDVMAVSEHRHSWLAVAMTNLVICECGERRRWWEVPAEQEPFSLGRYAPQDVSREIERNAR